MAARDESYVLRMAIMAYQAIRDWNLLSGKPVGPPWNEASQSVQDLAKEGVRLVLDGARDPEQPGQPWEARLKTELFRAIVLTMDRYTPKDFSS